MFNIIISVMGLSILLAVFSFLLVFSGLMTILYADWRSVVISVIFALMCAALVFFAHYNYVKANELSWEEGETITSRVKCSDWQKGWGYILTEDERMLVTGNGDYKLVTPRDTVMYQLSTTVKFSDEVSVSRPKEESESPIIF